MLASNVLKLRLDRIEQQGHHLSVRDQLKLVTLTQPDLTANVYSHLLHITLPKTWHFYHGNAEEIASSLRLIQLINQVFIPAYQRHARRYAWLEQCLAFSLQYANQKLSPDQLHSTLRQLEQCKDSPLKASILKQLDDEYQNSEIKQVLAELYQRLEDWSAAIECYQALFTLQPLQPESLHYDFIHCLLSRNAYMNAQGQRDVVQALEHLGNLEEIQQPQRHEQLTCWAVSLMLPETLQIDSTETNKPKSLIELQKKLKFVGYSVNHWLTPSDVLVPYYPYMIEQAPQLLNHHEIVSSLDRHNAANAALQKVLTGQDLKLIHGVATATYSLGFIWNYLHINPLVLDAIVAASKGNTEDFYNLKHIAAPDLERTQSRLFAYLAKQQVAYNLSQQGHTVEFAEHSQSAGFDLIVDGTPMQVKCSLAAEEIEQFAQCHPHIAMIVNIELAHLQEKYASVFVDLALSYESVQQLVQASMQQLTGEDDFLPIPLMNTGFAVYRNFSQSRIRHKPSLLPANSASDSMVKNSLAMGAVLGGLVSGSIGALLISSFAVYRIWRVQQLEQHKPAQEKQQLILQRNKVMDLLIDFAEWFHQDILKYRVDVYAYQLRQIEMKLLGKIPESVISTTLYAYKFAAYQRALQLYQWMQKQLAHTNPKYQAQAGWAALERSNQFMSVELKQRVAQLNAVLEQYKQLTQHGDALSSMTRQAENAMTQSAYSERQASVHPTAIKKTETKSPSRLEAY